MKHFLAIIYKKKLLKLFKSFPALGSEPGSFFHLFSYFLLLILGGMKSAKRQRQKKVLKWIRNIANAYLAGEEKLTRGNCYKTFYGRNLRMFGINWSVCSWQTYTV